MAKPEENVMEAAIPGWKQILLASEPKKAPYTTPAGSAPKHVPGKGTVKDSGVSFLSCVHGWLWPSPELSHLELDS